MEGMEKAGKGGKDVKINTKGSSTSGEVGEEGEGVEEGEEGATASQETGTDQLQEGGGEEEVAEQAPELTEEEIENQRIE